MPIRGLHAMFYTSEPGALRTFFRDKLGLAADDVGEGWLLFDLPEADLGCHPTEGEGDEARPRGRPTSPSTATTSSARWPS